MCQALKDWPVCTIEERTLHGGPWVIYLWTQPWSKHTEEILCRWVDVVVNLCQVSSHCFCFSGNLEPVSSAESENKGGSNKVENQIYFLSAVLSLSGMLKEWEILRMSPWPLYLREVEGSSPLSCDLEVEPEFPDYQQPAGSLEAGPVLLCRLWCAFF